MQTATTAGPKHRIILIAAGTAVAILAGGVLFQIYRADTAAGPDRAAAAENESAGRVSLAGNNAAQGQALASVMLGSQRILISETEVSHEALNRVGKEVLDSMINRTIIQLACEERGVTVTESEVKQEVLRIAKEFNIPLETWYQMLQSERDLSAAQYHRDVIWPMLALRKLASENVVVSDNDLKIAFDRNFGQRVKARMIMLDNLRRANEVWEKAVKNPEDFGRLAREHSIDPGSRPLDGQIPPIPRYSSSEEIEKAAFSMKEGEVSGIVQFGTPARYVILKCEGRTEQKISSIAEPGIREQLVKEIEGRKTQESAARIFDQLKQRVRVDNYLTNTTTGGVQQTSGSSPAGGAVRPAAGTRPAIPGGAGAPRNPAATGLPNQR